MQCKRSMRNPLDPSCPSLRLFVAGTCSRKRLASLVAAFNVCSHHGSLMKGMQPVTQQYSLLDSSLQARVEYYSTVHSSLEGHKGGDLRLGAIPWLSADGKSSVLEACQLWGQQARSSTAAQPHSFLRS